MQKKQLNKINHPYGNFKSSLFKFCKNLIQYTTRSILSLVCKLKEDDNILISSATHSPWIRDKKFKLFYSKVKNLTLLDEQRSYTLWKISQNLRDVNASILDVGCLLGGSGFLLSKANNKGIVYLFDSFQGFEESHGLHKKEDIFYFEDINSVKRNISLFKLKNTFVEKAFFPNRIKAKINKIKLCHLDVNTYNSTKKAFQWVEKKMIKGGVIIFDDFGIWGVDGIKKFIYSIEAKLEKKYIFINNYSGQCILIKK